MKLKIKKNEMKNVKMMKKRWKNIRKEENSFFLLKLNFHYYFCGGMVFHDYPLRLREMLRIPNAIGLVVRSHPRPCPRPQPSPSLLHFHSQSYHVNNLNIMAGTAMKARCWQLLTTHSIQL